jgi:hypothetical protein
VLVTLTISGPKKLHHVDVGPLDVLRLVAPQYGYGDLDCQKDCRGWEVKGFPLPGNRGKAPIHVRGLTLHDCMSKFLDQMGVFE